MSVIQRIKELREKATYTETYLGLQPALTSDNLQGMKELYVLLPQLIQEHEALLRFVETVRPLGEEAMSEDYQCLTCKYGNALTQLDKELKG